MLLDEALDEALEGEPEYDAATCVTAAELRDLGLTLPESIPDCGWVTRSSLKFDAEKMGDLILSAKLVFSEPFRWINLTVRLDGTQEV